MQELLAAVVNDAEPLAAGFHRAEVIEVRAGRIRSRKHRINEHGCRSGSAVTAVEPMMIRVAKDGLEAHIVTDSWSGVVGALDEAGSMLRYGRRFAEPGALHPVVDWPQDRYVDSSLENPEQALIALWDLIQKESTLVGERFGLGIAVTEVQITDKLYAEAFARSGRGTRSFAATRIEARLLVEVTRDQRRARLWAARDGGCLADPPLADILTEAAFRGAAMLAGAAQGQSPRNTALLLAPRATAAMLRVLANDVFERPDVHYPETRLRHLIIDDPHVRGGGHVRPFDHEGSPTARTVLVDEAGRKAVMVDRARSWATSAGANRLTGNSYSLAGHGAPRARATNVSIVSTGGEDDGLMRPESFSGLVGLELRGEGTQQIRAGNTIRFRIEAVEVRQGAVTGPATTIFVCGTVQELVAAMGAVSPTAGFIAWRDNSTGCAWTLFPDVDRLANA